MDLPTELIAVRKVCFTSPAHLVSCKPYVGRRAAHDRKWLSRPEAQLRIETQALIVVAGLHQPHAGSTPLGGTVEDVLHQKSADASLLCRRVDRDRTDPDNLRAFIHEIASRDFSISHGNDSIEAGMPDEHRQKPRRNLG